MTRALAESHHSKDTLFYLGNFSLSRRISARIWDELVAAHRFVTRVDKKSDRYELLENNSNGFKQSFFPIGITNRESLNEDQVAGLFQKFNFKSDIVT